MKWKPNFLNVLLRIRPLAFIIETLQLVGAGSPSVACTALP